MRAAISGPVAKKGRGQTPAAYKGYSFPPQSKLRSIPALWQVVGRVATPCLGRGQVAILRPHVASLKPRNDCSILLSEGSVCSPGH
jgi:hypothetical protein